MFIIFKSSFRRQKWGYQYCEEVEVPCFNFQSVHFFCIKSVLAHVLEISIAYSHNSHVPNYNLDIACL